MRALGIDYGRKRIGLALSDATGMLARPWKTIASSARAEQVVDQIVREVDTLRDESDGLHVIVLGYPRRLSGDANEQTPVVEALAARLRAATAVDVVLQDERLSSHEADRLLARSEPDWRKRKPLLDAAAAAIILQDYLDTRS